MSSQLQPLSASLLLGTGSSLKGIWIVSSGLREDSSIPVDIGAEDCGKTQNNGHLEGN